MAVTISLSITQNSQNIANNTSNVTVKCKAKWTYGSWNAEGTASGSITIDGTKYSFTGITFNKGQTTNGSETVMTKTVDVTHDDDGSKTLKCSATLDTRVSSDTVKTSATQVLTTIARASQPSCITYPDHTQNVGNFGATISIHMNRKSSEFTHTVRYEFGTLSGTCIDADTGAAATAVGTGFRWKIPESFMELLTDKTYGSGTIYADTYKGTTKVGTKYCGFTATISDSVKPTCTLALDDTTGVDDIYGSPVKGLSKIKVTVTGNPVYKSPIKSYSISVNGVTYNTSVATTDVLQSSGSVPVTVSVKDARGRTGANSYTMSVLNYAAPAVTKLAAIRCNQDGTANRRGSYIKVTFSATVSSMSSKNTASYKLKYKKTSDAIYASVTFTALANNYAPTDQSYIFAAAVSNSYDVVLEATDRHSTTPKSTKASTASAIFSWRGFKSSSGKQDGAGIGKVPEKPNTLQVGWVSEFEEDITIIGTKALYGAQGIVDTRDTNETPAWYMANRGRGVLWEFKTLSKIGFTNPSATFGALQTIIPWKDSSGGLPRQIVYEGGIRWTRIATTDTSWGAWVSDLLRAYPVGSIYLAYNHTNPATLFGGTWERIYGAFPWFTDGDGVIGQTGGERTVTLTVNQIPAHSHGSVYSQHAAGTKDKAWYSTAGSSVAYGTVETGGGQAHNNMPPFIQISAWRRTA